MSPQSKTILKFSLSIVLTGFFLYLAFRNTNLRDLYLSLSGANYWWLLVMFVCLILSHLLRALRWRYLLEPIKPNIGLRNLFSGVMVGYMMNNVLPRAGELVRPYTIGKLESIPKSAALGTIVVERLMDMFSFLMLIIILPLVYNGPLSKTFPWLQQAGTLTALMSFGLLGIMVTLMVRRDWANIVIMKIQGVLPEKIARRVEDVSHSFLDGFLFLKRPGNFFVILLLTVLVWGLYLLMTYVAFFAFGLQDQLDLSAAVVVLAISSIGVAIPTPGATGTYHFFTSETLKQLFHVDPNIALSYATATHAVGFVGVTIIGLYYFLHDHIKVLEAVNDGSERAA